MKVIGNEDDVLVKTAAVAVPTEHDSVFIQPLANTYFRLSEPEIVFKRVLTEQTKSNRAKQYQTDGSIESP